MMMTRKKSADQQQECQGGDGMISSMMMVHFKYCKERKLLRTPSCVA